MSAVHDLNNPISSIVSSCDYLMAYCTDNLEADAVEMIRQVETSAQALLRHSDQIRELASTLAPAEDPA
jgi:hypothetical protein